MPKYATSSENEAAGVGERATIKEQALDLFKLKFKFATGSRAYRFKTFFINHLEKILTERPMVADDGVKTIKIVDAVFAFKNSELTRMLAARGKHIISAESEKQIKLDLEIKKYIERNKESLSTPVKAFVTFQNEEGYLRAVHLTKIKRFSTTTAEKYWFGSPLYFKAAPEPSNILWENIYFP